MARTKSKTELFGKHPLAKAIEPIIEKWSQENYPPVNGKQITHITKELMDYWFSDMAHEGEFFHPCQRRAIETIIYCYEILGIPHVKALFEQFSCELLEKDNLHHGIESMEHPRFAVKNYILLPQNIFDEMEGSGLRSLIERCESNLALLKMKRE